MKRIFVGLFACILIAGSTHAAVMPKSMPNQTAESLSKDKDFITLINATLKYHSITNQKIMRNMIAECTNVKMSSSAFKEKLSKALGYASVAGYEETENLLKNLREKVQQKFPSFTLNQENALTKEAVILGAKNKAFDVAVTYNERTDYCDLWLYWATAGCFMLQDEDDFTQCILWTSDVWLNCIIINS